MKKRALIELTPLLDVILLLLFAFLINMQGQSDIQQKEYDEVTQKYEQSQQLLQDTITQKELLENALEVLTLQKNELQEQIIKLTSQIDYETTANDKEKETLDNAMKAFSEITNTKSEEFNALLNKKEDASKALSDIVDAQDIVLEMYKYSFVMNRFYFIDIELIGANNRLTINGEETQLAIGEDDNKDNETRREKSIKIYDELQHLINARSGGDEMIMIILIVNDTEVYQYAYEIAWEALRELELRANGYRLYKTSYTYIK